MKTEVKFRIIKWTDLNKTDRDRIAASRNRLAAHIGKRIHDKVTGGAK